MAKGCRDAHVAAPRGAHPRRAVDGEVIADLHRGVRAVCEREGRRWGTALAVARPVDDDDAMVDSELLREVVEGPRIGEEARPTEDRRRAVLVPV